MVKLSEIKWFPSQKELPDHFASPGKWGYNRALDKIGNREITLNRDKLVKVIQEYFGIIEVESFNEMYKDMGHITEKVINWSMTHGLSDAIIANLKDIVIGKEDK